MRLGNKRIEPGHEDKHITSFWGFKQPLQWVVMHLVLKNAISMFKHAMDDALEGKINTKHFMYDVVVLSKSIDEHQENLGEIFLVIRRVGLKAHPSKCIFGASDVPSSGRVLSGKGMTQQPAKAAAIVVIEVLVDLVVFLFGIGEVLPNVRTSLY